MNAIHKSRASNMELLRIVAMLLVMVVHASYRALPKPTPEAIMADSTSVFLQLLAESFSIMAVNVFVMLSGWFGIRCRWVRVCELLFQVTFFSMLCLAICHAIQGFLPGSAFLSVFMLGENDYWFVKTYLALYLLSPVLNAFAESATRRQFACVLMAFFAFQWVYGWVFEATSWLRSGYSLPSFVALYLLARYLSLHRPWYARFSSRTDLGIYLGVSVLLCIGSFLLKRHFNLGGVLFFYNSPVVILAATYLLLFFSKLSFSSRVVNWLAVSVLSIYLTHSNTYLGLYYDQAIRLWHDTMPRAAFLAAVALLVALVFTGSILLDKIRIFMWQTIVKRVSAWQEHHKRRDDI